MKASLYGLMILASAGLINWIKKVPISVLNELCDLLYNTEKSKLMLNMKMIRKGERKGLRSNCVETRQDWDSGMSRT